MGAPSNLSYYSYIETCKGNIYELIENGNVSAAEGFNSTKTWPAYLSVLLIIALESTYVTIALVFYHCTSVIKIKRDRRRSCSGSGKKSIKFGRYIRISSIVTAISILLVTIAGIASQVGVKYYPCLPFCSLMITIIASLRSMSEILMNTILWLRQRIFYNHPVLRPINSFFTNCVSWALLIIMIMSSVTSLAILLVTSGPGLIPEQGCSVVKNDVMETISMHASLGLMIGLIVTYRVLFLGLLIYPLMRHRAKLRSSHLAPPSEEKLLAVIKRVIFVDCMCIAVFIATTILVEFMRGQSLFLFIFAWEMELIFGFFFIILSFVDWRERLLPCLNVMHKVDVSMEIQSVRNGSRTFANSAACSLPPNILSEGDVKPYEVRQ